jgi:hypothetical protein
VLAHNNQTIRARCDFLHDDSLVDVWLTQNRMQSCHDWHFETLQQPQYMAAGLPPKNPILVLQTHYIDVAGIKKVGRCSIGGEVALGYLESHARRVAVARLRVIDGYYEHSSGSVLSRNRITQVCCEGRNSTLSREMIPDNRYPHWK